MSRKNVSATADDILVSILDPKVLEALGKSLAPIIAQAIEANLTRRIEELSVSVKTLQDSNVILVQKQEVFEREIADLRKRLRENEGRIEDVETYSRAHDLIIRGVPDNSYAGRAQSNTATTTAETSIVLEDTIMELCQKTLGVQVERRDICGPPSPGISKG
jgi:hypothetical protein